MLNELEQKIRKAIPELEIIEFGYFQTHNPIQLNHVLEYADECNASVDDQTNIIWLWNLKSNLLSDQPIEVIRFVNELKKD